MGSFTNYIESALFEFRRYKTLGDQTFAQLCEAEVHWRYGKTDNSIALIVKHLAGNMKSRWTHFLTEDGEKSWRHRDTEFEDAYATKSEMIAAWESGWELLFSTLNKLHPSDFNTNVKIRGESHTVIAAINRQLAHYAYHVGQLVVVGKMIRGTEWVSLSIPRGDSEKFNKRLFG